MQNPRTRAIVGYPTVTEGWQDPRPKAKKARASRTAIRTTTAIIPNAQPSCMFFALPAELRNEIYLLVIGRNGKGVVRDRKSVRHSTTSLDPLSLTCKIIRHEYLDVLAKEARNLVATEFEHDGGGAGFVNTFLLRHEVADPNQTQDAGIVGKTRRRRGTRRGPS